VSNLLAFFRNTFSVFFSSLGQKLAYFHPGLPLLAKLVTAVIRLVGQNSRRPIIFISLLFTGTIIQKYND
jgi:hypothetical protein